MTSGHEPSETGILDRRSCLPGLDTGQSIGLHIGLVSLPFDTISNLYDNFQMSITSIIHKGRSEYTQLNLERQSLQPNSVRHSGNVASKNERAILKCE